MHRVKRKYFELPPVVFLFLLLSDWVGLTVLASYVSRDLGILCFLLALCVTALLFSQPPDEVRKNSWPIVAIVSLLLITTITYSLLFWFTGLIGAVFQKLVYN